MASVHKVGERWRALIRKKGHKPQCKTFGTKAAADVWARAQEAAIDRGEAQAAASTLTIAQLVEAYRELREETRPISDSANEHYMLKTITACLGDKLAAALSTDDLVEFAKRRRTDGAGPYTINMDLSKLGTVYRYGGAVLRVVLPDVVGAARPTLTYLRLIGGGGKRERRPTGDELARVLAHFKTKHGPRFHDAVEFSALTAMRRGEVTEVVWADLDADKRLLWAMRKHPRKGKVREAVPLLGRAWDIVQAQPKDDPRIFPFSGHTLSKYFTEACRALSIPDLHLHDLRHEGTSVLFEAGYSIEQVALVTGHKDWRNLRRYANLRPEDLHAVKV